MKQQTTILVAVSLAGIAALTMARPMLAPSAGDYIPVAQKSGVKESSLSLNANGAKKLRIDINFGGVELRTAATSELTAKVKKEITGAVDTPEKKQWLQNDWLKVRRDGDTLVVYEDPALKPKTFKGKVNLDFTVSIQVPKGLLASVAIAAGSAKIQGEFESVVSTIEAGDMEVRNLTANRSLDLTVKAGQIDTDLSQPPRDDSKMHVHVGQINFNSKGNAFVDAAVSMGSIEVNGEEDKDQDGFSAKREVRIGTGGTKINLRVDTGAIMIGGGKTTKKSSTKIKGDYQSDFEDKDFSVDLPQDLDKTIEAALRAAEVESRAALVDARQGMEKAQLELERLSPQIQRDVERALAEARKELANAKLDEAGHRAAMAEAREEMKRAQADMERELKNRGPEMRREIERALAEARKELSNAKFDEAGHRAAMAEAREEMKRARADMERELKSRGPEMRREIERELEQARKEMKAAIKESQKAMAEARKEMERARKEAQKERSKDRDK